MTPQDNFMVAAPVKAGEVAALRALLATMNGAPGTADPRNRLVPFERFETLHFARLVVVDDETLGDLAAYRVRVQDPPVYLLFLGECDGPAGETLNALAREADEGLRRIFGFCEGYTPGIDLVGWLKRRLIKPTTQYINWIGRGVRQIREEAALHAALTAALARLPASETPAYLRAQLKAAVADTPLTTLPPAPLAWRLRTWADLIGGVMILTVLALPLLIYLPFFLLILLGREARDAVIAPSPQTGKMTRIGAADDHDVTNAFSAVGSLKPGIFRLTTVKFVLWLLNWANRHIYNRGHLARVGTIHFARWVLLDNNRRLFFASNYDGALDSYMDDFINKAGFGLNLVFGNGAGYPRTRYLLLEGAQDEQAFKAFLRRHQVPTDVWYKAYPGLTTFDLQRNAAIRQGLERTDMTGADLSQWLALI